MADKLRWGIIGTGRIAHAFAEGLAQSKTGTLAAVGSRTQESAEQFGVEFGVAARHGSYEALLADPAVETIYISTPHPMHAEWTIKAADAGKHILCEKPLTLNYAEAMAVVEAVEENDVFLMEAFMYRCHPQTAKLVELIRSGAIGQIGVIQATFSFQGHINPKGRLWNRALGGGGILDVGCYCTSMARLIAGAAVGKDFEEPLSFKGAARIGETGVDEYAIASLEFPNGILAQLATGISLWQESVVRIFGSEGWLVVPSPWMPARGGGDTAIIIHREGMEPEEVVVHDPRPLYTIEADIVAAGIKQGARPFGSARGRQATPPAMTWEDTLGNMRTLDSWRASIGLVYEMEKPEAQKTTVAGRPLAARGDNTMRYGEIAGIPQPVSRLVMGTMGHKFPQAAVMFDSYFEQGGNCFDTAYVYGGSDETLGRWVNSRAVRDQVIVVAKAAHSPLNRPDVLRPQLMESLERMRTDYADFLLAHRDNTDIPVGEWADAWNDLLRDGLIRAYGGSNWCLDRIEALNQYARSKGLVGMACVSNNFSLARMVAPVWRDCIASSDPESRAWLTKMQLPLLSWSSQARGFFTERSGPDKLSDKEMAHSWYSEDNFRRKARAEELAAQRGVPPITIALAYVLCQPFPTYALIGPATLAEMRESLAALSVDLSPAELQWLNLEE